MICPHCGTDLPDNAKFCGSCGNSVTPPETRATRKAQQKKKFNPLFVIIPVAVIVIAAAVIAGIKLFGGDSETARPDSRLDTAAQYIADGEYQKAANAYAELLSEKPGDKEGSLGLAEAYLNLGKFSKAASALEELGIDEDDKLFERYDNLNKAAKFAPELDSVDASGFPKVVLNFTCGDKLTPSIGLEDNGAAKDAEIEFTDDNHFTVTYTADGEAGTRPESRTGSAELGFLGFNTEFDVEYDTPVLRDALIKLVSTDVSEYPKVKCYFSVTDKRTGEPIEGLDLSCMTIKESIEGGEYLYREVDSVETLNGHRGLNISLVADKSDSISYDDMQKIKNIMSEFTDSLNFSVGDRAEVIAFDSIVQQMCAFTSEPALLKNGIRSMSTDGLTAFYDAVHDGIAHASLQGGARCVIAFTDGIDNRSRFSEYDVINYSLTQQVPVYIIGVGYSVEEQTLRYVAEETGGRYWFIDDLYDLTVIFNQIYSEQMDYYEVCYESSAGPDCYAPRKICIDISGGGCKGSSEQSFTPVYSVPTGQTHASRYLAFRESLTWEEAAARCEQLGGHLATVTSSTEEDEIIALLEKEDIKYCWLGGYTSYDDYGNVFGHWVTGETFGYSAWSGSEPSRVDQDGTDEWYVMLWNVPSLNGWYWNDQRNDPVAAVPYMESGMGFVCEFEN